MDEEEKWKLLAKVDAYKIILEDVITENNLLKNRIKCLEGEVRHER